MRLSLGQALCVQNTQSACPRLGETVNITFYESYSTTGFGFKCDHSGAQIGRATRCSADRGGVVYILDVAVDGGNDAVCGMD